MAIGIEKTLIATVNKVDLKMLSMKKITQFTALSSIAFAIGLATPVAAQELDRITQGIEDGVQKRVTLQPRNDLTVSTDETELLPSLKGIVIINSPADLTAAGTSGNGGVEVRGDFASEQAVGAAGKYIGQAVSLASLDRLTRDMVLGFRAGGYPVVNVVVPPQDISNGVVQVIAVVGRFAELNVTGESENFDYYSEGFPLQQGDVVDQDLVLDHLRWKSRRFHRSVSAIYEPGKGFGQTNIELNANDSKPWTVFSGVDNTGTGVTGDFRIFGGFTVGDFLAEDHEFSYQLTSTEEGFDALNAHVASYTLPVTFIPKTDFQLAGAYIDTESDLDVGASDGTNFQISGNFRTQLPTFNNISIDARYGFEYKNADNTFAFGGIPVSDNETEVGQFYGQLIGFHGNGRVSTQFDLGVWASPGDLFGNNDDEAFNGTREGAESDYVYFRGGVEQVYFLPQDWRFNIDIDGQVTPNRLITSEQIFIGGFNSIRGLDENALRGDSGILGSIQLETPSIQLLSHSDEVNFKDGLRGYAFLDAGSVSADGTATVGDDEGSAVTAGLGFLYQVNNNFTVEGAFGYPLAEDGDIGDDDGRFNFRIIGRF